MMNKPESTRPFLAVQRRIMRRVINRGKRIHDLVKRARRLFHGRSHPVVKALEKEAAMEYMDYMLSLDMALSPAPGLYDFLIQKNIVVANQREGR